LIVSCGFFNPQYAYISDIHGRNCYSQSNPDFN
jgi:hypothetical protein